MNPVRLFFPALLVALLQACEPAQASAVAAPQDATTTSQDPAPPAGRTQRIEQWLRTNRTQHNRAFDGDRSFQTSQRSLLP